MEKGSEARKHEDSCNDAKRVVIAAEKRGDRQQPSIQPALDDPTNSALLLATARKHLQERLTSCVELGTNDESLRKIP